MASALRTVKGAIIGAGAIALALAAIWALIPHPKPVEVHFVSVDLSPAPVPLSQFRPVEGKFAPTALSWGHESGPAAMVAFVQTGQASTVSKLSVRSLTELALATTSPSPGATDSLTTSTPPTTDATTPSATPSSTSGSTTDTSSPSTGAGGPFKLTKNPKAYVSDVLKRVRTAGYRVGDDEIPWVTYSYGGSTGPGGELMPAPEAAARVIEALSHVRAHASGDKKEPVGVVLNVRMALVNARDVPVRIYWEMTGAGGPTNSMSDDWLGSIPAYLLYATEDVDSGTFKLWVPLPKEKGDYVVSLYARTTNKELPDDSISTSSFH